MTARRDKFDPGAISRNWWSDLNGSGKKQGRDRAAFAELRRCTDPLSIAFVPAFDRLRRRFGIAAANEKGLERLADIAVLLAHVTEDDGRPVARALGPVPSGQAAMSEARFRRLLQADDRADCLRRLTRAIKMLKGKANVADLAEAVWYWNDRTKRRWAFAYLDANQPDDERGPVQSQTMDNGGSGRDNLSTAPSSDFLSAGQSQSR